jgi:hypothetical protein
VKSVADSRAKQLYVQLGSSPTPLTTGLMLPATPRGSPHVRSQSSRRSQSVRTSQRAPPDPLLAPAQIGACSMPAPDCRDPVWGTIHGSFILPASSPPPNSQRPSIGRRWPKLLRGTAVAITGRSRSTRPRDHRSIPTALSAKGKLSITSASRLRWLRVTFAACSRDASASSATFAARAPPAGLDELNALRAGCAL